MIPQNTMDNHGLSYVFRFFTWHSLAIPYFQTDPCDKKLTPKLRFGWPSMAALGDDDIADLWRSDGIWAGDPLSTHQKIGKSRWHK